MPYFFDVCYGFSFHFFRVKNFSMALFYFHLEMKKMPHANLLRECYTTPRLNLKNSKILFFQPLKLFKFY